jgi:D-alanyl-D-alanine carboxypeptidase
MSNDFFWPVPDKENKMNWKKMMVFLLLFFLVFYCRTKASPTDLDKLTHELQIRLDQLIGPEELPGATLAVVLADGREICLASGLADLKKKKTMAPTDRMFSGSIGKTYVAAIILQLAEENKLHLDDPVKSYFKGERWYTRLPQGEELTLRMLLNHTAGIPEYAARAALWADLKKFPDKIWQPLDRLNYILGDKPMNAPGQAWNYADTHYIILGMIIEKITGDTYYNELDKRILKPFKLTRTTPADKRVLEGLVPGYSRLGAPFFISGKVMADNGRYIFNPQLEWTGGGLVTTSRELALWARLLYEAKVFSRDSLQKMLTGVDSGEGFQYGLGVFIWNSDFGISYGHSGFVPGYNSIMEYVPGYRFSVALQFNCDNVSQLLKKNRHDNATEFIRIVIKYLKENKRTEGL